MVCDDCAKKIKKLITIDNKNERKFGKLKIKLKNEVSVTKCKICNCKCENNNKFCLICAFKEGICEKCGKKIFNKNLYKFQDTHYKDYLRKKRNIQMNIDLNKKLIKEKGLDKLFENKKKKKFKKIIKNNNNNNNNNNNEKKVFKELLPLNEDENNNKKNKELDLTQFDEIIEF